MRRFLTASRGAAMAIALLLALTACGDDGGSAAEDDVTAYCNAAAELDQQETLPSDEQLTELEGLAPEEISEELAVAADGLREMGTDAFEDPDVSEAFTAIQAFEEEHCPQSEDGAAGEE